MFLRLRGGPEVPAPQAGVQTPRPDVLAFDRNALGSIWRAQQVPGQETERVETLSFGPQARRPPNHSPLADGDTQASKKGLCWAPGGRPGRSLNLGLRLSQI